MHFFFFKGNVTVLEYIFKLTLPTPMVTLVETATMTSPQLTLLVQYLH